MAKTRKGSTVFDLSAGANTSIKASEGIDTSHSTPLKDRKTYEITPGVSTKDLKPLAQLRCPAAVRDKIRWHAMKNHKSMNLTILEMLMEAERDEGWENPPAYFADMNSATLRGGGGRWSQDIHGYNTEDLECSVPIRMPEELFLKMKLHSVKSERSLTEVIFKIVADRIEDWEEAPDWCKTKPKKKGE